MSKLKPKLLVLSPRFPYPVIGGDRLRIVELCRQLSKDFSISLLCLCEHDDELTMLAPEDSPFDTIERVYLPKWRSYLNCSLAVFSRLPLQVAYYYSRAFQGKLSSMLGDHDMVLAHLIRTGHYLGEVSKPKVLEMTDAISLNYKRIKETKTSASLKSLVFRFEQARLERYEQQVIGKFDRTVLISPVDKAFLESGNASSSVIVCSNGVNVGEFPFQARFGSKELVFIGCMTTVQNMDAALWFAENVMPLISPEGFVFKVIGRIDAAFAERLTSFPSVIVTGTVNSIADAASNALIGVCPMRVGAGVQNKVLEYMSLGLPTISSPLGLEGIEADEGVLMSADAPEEWAMAIRTLYSGQQLWSKMSSLGRKYVESHHSWESMVKPYREELVSLLGSRSKVCAS